MYGAHLRADGRRPLARRGTRCCNPSRSAVESVGANEGLFALMWVRDGQLLQGRQLRRRLPAAYARCFGRRPGQGCRVSNSDEESMPILNVDGQTSSRFLRSRILEEAGYRVREARSAGEALAFCKTAKPALVLL